MELKPVSIQDIAEDKEPVLHLVSRNNLVRAPSVD